MRISPISIRDADKFVALNHRHNKQAGNGKFAISCYEGEELIGVAIAGRPRSRHLDNGLTCEVYRVCTTGFKNSTSFLYNRVKRIAQLMGYEKVITYTLQSESGSSLKAIGAVIEKNMEHKKQWNNYQPKPKSGMWPDKKEIRRNHQEVTTQLKFRWTL